MSTKNDPGFFLFQQVDIASSKVGKEDNRPYYNTLFSSLFFLLRSVRLLRGEEKALPQQASLAPFLRKQMNLGGRQYERLSL